MVLLLWSCIYYDYDLTSKPPYATSSALVNYKVVYIIENGIILTKLDEYISAIKQPMWNQCF